MSEHLETSHSIKTVMDWTLLWGKAQNSVKAYIHASVLNAHDREDVLQSTVQYLIEHFAEYDPQRPFIAWAIGIARYRVLDYRQKQSIRRRELGGDALQMVTDAFIDHFDDFEPRSDALRQCLQMLSQKQLRIVSRKYYDGASHEVIASEFDMKPNTVSVMIRRVRLALAKCIEARMESEAC